MLRSFWLLGLALWLGSSFGVTWLAIPAVFSPEYKELAGPYAAGRAAQGILARLFLAQYVFGGLFCLGLLWQRHRLRQFPGRFAATLLPVVTALGLAAGLGLQPRLKAWHQIMYDPATPTDQKTLMTGKFRAWHGVSQAGNLAAMIGLTLAFVSTARRQPSFTPGPHP